MSSNNIATAEREGTAADRRLPSVETQLPKNKESKRATGIPYYEGVEPGTFMVDLSRGDNQKASVKIEFIGAKQREMIENLFKDVFTVNDSKHQADTLLESDRLAQASGSPEDLIKVKNEIAQIEDRERRAGVAGIKYQELKNFFVELTGGLSTAGINGTPRIARVLDTEYVLKNSPLIKVGDQNSSRQNRDISGVSAEEVFVISAADGERLKKIVGDCSQVDQDFKSDGQPILPTSVEDHTDEKLMVTIRGVRFVFIFHDNGSKPDHHEVTTPTARTISTDSTPEQQIK